MVESNSYLISEQFACCMKLFRQLVFSGSEGVVPTFLWEDAFGKLKIWAANIGAQGTEAASLDHRLRDASHMREQVSRVLRAIQQNLEDLRSTSDDSLDDSVEDPFGSDVELDTSIPEQQQIYHTIQELIGCLFSLSMVIRRPAQRDRLRDSRKEDSSGYEPFDLQHVLNKYPQIDPSVGARLAGAITRRRRELKYFERHRAKLGRDIEDMEDNTGRTVLSSTIASRYDDSDPNLSSTAWTMTDVSATSYGSSLFDSDIHITVPPPPPDSANGAPFECPYCKYIVTVKGSRAWARHVFTDLRPYLCVFHNCEVPGRRYETRRDLVKHLLEHMTAERALEGRCPLCGTDNMTSQTMGRHLGRHLEELALFALPRSEDTQENDGLHQGEESGEETDEPDIEKLSDSELDDMDHPDDPTLRKAKMPQTVPGGPSTKVSGAEEETTIDPRSPLGRLNPLYDKLHNIWVPQCNRLLASPPSTAAARKKEYQRLSESILAQIVIAADNVDIGADSVARRARRRLIDEANDIMMALDTEFRG